MLRYAFRSFLTSHYPLTVSSHSPRLTQYFGRSPSFFSSASSSTYPTPFQLITRRRASNWSLVNGFRRLEIPWSIPDHSSLQLGRIGWYGNLKSIAERVRSQALESYCLWHGPLWKGLYGKLWLAERWLLVSGLLRNSRSWMSNFTAGIMRPEQMFCVATVNSLNTVGNHIPKMTLLLFAQVIAKIGSAEAPTRDSYIPWSRSMTDQSLENSIVASWWIKGWNEISIWFRLCKLMLFFFPLFALYPFTSIDESIWKFWIQYLRYTLENCGPAFIKWGQWASSRRDLFPVEVALELRKLQKDAPAHSGNVSKQTIRSSFGMPVDLIFEEFDEQPIASGSIGQVHRAKLGHTGALMSGVPLGTEVAVKVRHPGVDAAFQRDMKLMLWIADIIDKVPLSNGFNLHEIICQFSIPMTEQVDFCVEAANLQCFRHNFRRKRNKVVFPEPLFPLVTPDIIVESFHNGRSVEDIIENIDGKETQLARLGSETFFDMMIRHNLLHADLHPGNILVQYTKPKTLLEHFQHSLMKPLADSDEESSKNELMPNIILLDAGMAAQLTSQERFHMLGLFRALADNDGAAAADHTLQFAGEKQTCPTPEAFKKDVIEHFNSVTKEDWSESGFESGSDALGRVIDIVREHKVSLPGQICSCLFTVFILEGWSSKLDPEHSLMDQVKGLVRKFDKKFETRIRKRAHRVLQNELVHL